MRLLPLFLSCLALAGGPPPEPRPLLALSYNIRTSMADRKDALVGNDWTKRRPLALRMLKELDPDIVGIQEATDGQVQDLQPGFQVFRQVEVALLHRDDRLRALEGGFLTLGGFGHPDPWGDRWVVWQRYEPRSGGRSFVVVMTHLSTEADHLPQAKMVLELAQEKGRDGTPVLVMGDFNFDASPLLAKGGFKDALEDRRGTFHAFKGGRDGERIDFIGVRGFQVLGGAVDTRSEPAGEQTLYPSDHYPIWARVKVLR